MTIYDLSEYQVLKVWAEMFFDAQEARIRTTNRVQRAPVFPDLFADELVAALESEKRIGKRLVTQYRHTAPTGVLAWQKTSNGIGEHLLARLLGHLGHPRIATPSHWEGTGTERKLVADEPYERRVGQLWQYCGHGNQGRPQKGMTATDLAALGCPSLKMIVHLIAECAIKQPGRRIADLLDPAQRPNALPNPNVGPVAEHILPQPIQQPQSIERAAGDSSTAPPKMGTQPRDNPAVWSPLPQPKSLPQSTNPAAGDSSTAPPNVVPQPTDRPAVWPYRAVYEQRRLVTLGRVHADPCVRCGPSGKPAPAGKAWSDGHAHADALRVVGKTILRDLWLAAEEDQS